MTSQTPSSSNDLASPSFWTRLRRLVRHGWLGDNDTHAVLPESDVDRVTQAVAQSEQRHAAQIRICVEASLPLSYAWRAHPMCDITRERAVRQFAHLRVWDTEHNNGVLIYLLLAEHAIEIVADRGISKVVPASEWNNIILSMKAQLSDEKPNTLASALIQAVDDVSSLLERSFPRSNDAVFANELPDAPQIIP